MRQPTGTTPPALDPALDVAGQVRLQSETLKARLGASMPTSDPKPSPVSDGMSLGRARAAMLDALCARVFTDAIAKTGATEPIALAAVGSFGRGAVALRSDIDVRLVLSDQLINLQESHIDLAVRISDLADSSLVATRIGAVRRVVCGSPSYFSERGKPKAPRDLSEHDCLSTNFGGVASSNVWVFAAGRTKAAVTVHSRLVGNADSAVAAAVAGFGITRVLSFHVADHLRNGTLVRVLKEFESPAVPVCLVHAGQGLVPMKVRAFLDFAAPRLKVSIPEFEVPVGVD